MLRKYLLYYENLVEYAPNKTIKDGDKAPWKDLKKDKRREQRNNYILIWGGSSSIFYSGLRRSGHAYVEYIADDM